jgi:hypothetical protein
LCGIRASVAWSAFAVADRADLDAVAAAAIVTPENPDPAVGTYVTVYDGANPRHAMPACVTMAVARTAAAVDTDRAAITPVTMGHRAPELGNIVAADVGVAAANGNDQVFAGRLRARGGEGGRGRRRHKGEAGGQAGRRCKA